MWSTLERSSGAKLGHDKRDISAFNSVLFHWNLSNLRRKFLSDVLTDKIVLSCGPKISERRLKRRYWWLKNKERKFHFRFVERRFLAAINCTGSAEGALVPVLLCITNWPKSGLPVSPPGLFPPCPDLSFLPAPYRGWTRAGERRLHPWMTELQNNCACVTYDPVGARGRENLYLSKTFLMKDQS